MSSSSSTMVGIIRIMDLVNAMVKDEDGGSYRCYGQLSTCPAWRLGPHRGDPRTLAADDVIELASVMAPGSVAAALVYENLWAAPFASALRRGGAQLVADGRIPIQAIAAAVEADAALEAEGA